MTASPNGGMRAVLFDAGGTLVHIDHARLARVVKDVLGATIPLDRFVAAEYAGRAAMEEGLASGAAPTDASRWSLHFRAMLGAVGVAGDDFDRVAPAMLAEHRVQHLWSVVPTGTAEALDALAEAGWCVGCVSNADGHVEELLAGLGLRARLRFVVDSGVVGVEKPDPRIFAIALERAGLPAEECYYVGDVHAVDVVGAGAAGLVPVLLDPLGRYADRGCRTTPDVPTFCRELVSLRDAA